MYVSVPKALINTMQGFQTILVLNVSQCSKGTHQYHARVSINIITQSMSMFQRHSLVPCKGFKQYYYSMYVRIPKVPINTMQGFQTILVLNVCQCSKGTNYYHAGVLNNISTQCMSVFQRHSLVPCKGFKQYYYSMYGNVAKHSLVPCKGFKQYQYSMYVSVPKALISNMQGFQTILVLNVCQCSKGTHQYHARVSNNISTQCISMFQRHPLVHARVSNNISTQSMAVFQRQSLAPCKGFKQYQYSMYVSVPKGFKQYQYSMYVSVPKALIITMQVFQTIIVLNVCPCSKGIHQ